MKKGINAWCFPDNKRLEEIFALTAIFRYQGLEINMNEHDGEFRLGITPSGWQSIRDMSERYQLPVISVSSALFWQYAFTDNDPAVREKAAAIAKEMIDAAAYLGCGAILAVPGVVTKDVSYKTAYERALDAFKGLAPYAEAQNIVIGVKNVWNKFLLSPLEMAAFIDEIGSDCVKIDFDAGNARAFAYPEQWVEILGTRITRVHIKDFDTDIGNFNGFKPLLQGHVNWKRFMDALRRTGYTGYLTAELGPYRASPGQAASDASVAMDYILGL